MFGELKEAPFTCFLPWKLHIYIYIFFFSLPIPERFYTKNSLIPASTLVKVVRDDLPDNHFYVGKYLINIY
jgi:hypothetical protein